MGKIIKRRFRTACPVLLFFAFFCAVRILGLSFITMRQKGVKEAKPGTRHILNRYQTSEALRPLPSACGGNTPYHPHEQKQILLGHDCFQIGPIVSLSTINPAREQNIIPIARRRRTAWRGCRAWYDCGQITKKTRL